MNILVNNTKNPYPTQGWAFQPVGRPGFGKVTNIMISNPPKDRKITPQAQNSNARKLVPNMLTQHNENLLTVENILSKRFSSPSAKLLPEIQTSAANPITNVASKQSFLTKLENEDYEIKTKNGKSGSALKAAKLINSTENLDNMFDNIEKDLELYTENRVNELCSKFDKSANENKATVKSQGVTKTQAIMTKPITQISDIERKIVLGKPLAKSNGNLNSSGGENFQIDSSRQTDDTSQRFSKPPISSQSRRMARQRTDHISALQNKTQGNLGPLSASELMTTDNDNHNIEGSAAEKMVTVLNEAKIILGPIGRNTARSHTQNGIRDTMNTSSRNINKTPDRPRGTTDEDQQKTTMNLAPKQMLRLKFKPALDTRHLKSKKLGDATENTLDFLLGGTQKNGLDAEPKHRMDEFVIERQLGQGSYAVVKLAREKKTNEKFAIKTYEKFKLYDASRRKNVKREISLLKDLDHPNIIRLYHTIDSTTQINLVMEMGGQQSLYSYLKTKSGRKLSEDEAKPIYKQIIQGMKYLHNRNIAHRDVKLENVLLDDDKRIKIIDFGFSVEMEKDKQLSTFCGTPSYMAPELATKKDYNGAEVDVWALGVLLYSILSGKFPFKGENDRDLYKKIARGGYPKIPDISAEAHTLISKMLRLNPQERLTTAQILEEQWLLGSHEDFKNYITEKMAECKSHQKV